MPVTAQDTSKKSAATTAYSLTGQSSRDSQRKRIYDSFVEALDGNSNTHPLGEWTTTLEEALYVEVHSQVNKDYRDKAALLVKNMKGPKKNILCEIMKNTETCLQELLVTKAEVKVTSKPATSSLTRPPVIRPPPVVTPIAAPKVVRPFDDHKNTAPENNKSSTPEKPADGTNEKKEATVMKQTSKGDESATPGVTRGKNAVDPTPAVETVVKAEPEKVGEMNTYNVVGSAETMREPVKVIDESPVHTEPTNCAEEKTVTTTKDPEPSAAETANESAPIAEKKELEPIIAPKTEYEKMESPPSSKEVAASEDKAAAIEPPQQVIEYINKDILSNEPNNKEVTVTQTSPPPFTLANNNNPDSSSEAKPFMMTSQQEEQYKAAEEHGAVLETPKKETLAEAEAESEKTQKPEPAPEKSTAGLPKSKEEDAVLARPELIPPIKITSLTRDQVKLLPESDDMKLLSDLRRGQNRRSNIKSGCNVMSSGKKDLVALQNAYRDLRRDLEQKKRKLYTSNNEFNYCKYFRNN